MSHLESDSAQHYPHSGSEWFYRTRSLLAHSVRSALPPLIRRERDPRLVPRSFTGNETAAAAVPFGMPSRGGRMRTRTRTRTGQTINATVLNQTSEGADPSHPHPLGASQPNRSISMSMLLQRLQQSEVLFTHRGRILLGTITMPGRARVAGDIRQEIGIGREENITQTPLGSLSNSQEKLLF